MTLSLSLPLCNLALFLTHSALLAAQFPLDMLFAGQFLCISFCFLCFLSSLPSTCGAQRCVCVTCLCRSIICWSPSPHTTISLFLNATPTEKAQKTKNFGVCFAKHMQIRIFACGRITEPPAAYHRFHSLDVAHVCGITNRMPIM